MIKSKISKVQFFFEGGLQHCGVSFISDSGTKLYQAK